MLTGAGSAELNGVYLRQKTGAKRNGARVYEKGEYMLSREVIGGGAGFIVGKAPRTILGTLSSAGGIWSSYVSSPG